ncbi:ABC transporter permease [Halarsenatibacter silvermanii]|uniref:ABC-2 type transport system permease protein n=1 Tax=Halarsenatibacter silvermanii TaxID=321763 RepID=A0A1G9LVJ3_9FIRM|nr:ABC transporter permease [Halarsenatibacter silvermanii]SDL65834.1 ABC-2 type transport system permease protein [Halarsenatibacter silvermanii]
MNYRLRIIAAILLKEFQDIKKNKNLLVMYFLPVLLTIIFTYFVPDMPSGFALNIGLLFLVVMMGMYVPSMLIAEEKEKKTLEVLLFSPAGAEEVLIGKGLLTYISILIVTLLLVLIVGLEGRSLIIIFLSTALISIFSIMVGMMVGLLSPDQRSTGTIGLPVYMLLLLVPQLAALSGAGVMNFLASLLPTTYYFKIQEKAIAQALQPGDLALEFAVLVISIFVSFIALVFLYRKKGI